MNKSTGVMMDAQNYYQANKKRIWIIGAIILCIVVLISVGFITKTVTAQRDAERTKLVACIEIKKGDTLWSIASEFMTDEYHDVNEYIEEIKDSNRMCSDDIRIGNYIIVPYYADASR